MRSVYGHTETTQRFAHELHDFFPDIELDVIIQVLIKANNDISKASSLLQEIDEGVVEPVKAAPQVTHKELKLRKKLDKLFPSASYDDVNEAINVSGVDANKVVGFLSTIYGLPSKGKYRKAFNRVKQLFPELENEIIFSLLLDANFNVDQITRALLNDPSKQDKLNLRINRQLTKLRRRFPKFDPEILLKVLEAQEFDYNKAFAEVKAMNEQSIEVKPNAIVGRLVSLYGQDNAELLEEICRNTEYNLQNALMVCTEIFGPPGPSRGDKGRVPLSQRDLRKVKSVALEGVTDAGFMPDREFSDKQFEMEALSRHAKALNIQAKDLRAQGNKAQAKLVMAEAKSAKSKHNTLYKELFEETFRRNNLRRDINTLDLHGLKLEEAMTVLESYLNVMQAMVRDQGLQEFKLLIITGWGKHNDNQRSVLKDRTAATLLRKRLNFREHNKGSFEVTLVS